MLAPKHIEVSTPKYRPSTHRDVINFNSENVEQFSNEECNTCANGSDIDDPVTFQQLKTIIHRRLENIALIAMFSTILILSAFVINEINENDKLEFNNTSPKDILKTLKLKNATKIIIGHLNINSIRNKIEDLKYLIADNIDILLISETKINNTFPESQFAIAGFHPPYRENRNENGGGLLLYFREHVPSKKITLNFYPKIEAIAIEINLKKKTIRCFIQKV